MQSKSIMQDNPDECFLCGRNGSTDHLEKHHCLHGTSNRKLADEDGLFVWLCGAECHRLGKYSAHQCKETDLWLKRKAQDAWELRYGSREDFIARYGKSYLDT